MYINHVLFIHSSVSEQLSFHRLALVINAILNIDIQISAQFLAFISFRYLPRCGIAGLYGHSVFKFFFRTTILFSTAAAPFCIPTSHGTGSSFSASPPTPVVFCIFLNNGQHPNECEVVLHSGFDLHFCNDYCC